MGDFDLVGVSIDGSGGSFDADLASGAEHCQVVLRVDLVGVRAMLLQRWKKMLMDFGTYTPADAKRVWVELSSEEARIQRENLSIDTIRQRTAELGRS
jgi:hypothetical protein